MPSPPTRRCSCVAETPPTRRHRPLGAAVGPGAWQGRIAAQVVTGLGFLGASTIIPSKGRVEGLATAAVIRAVAAVGVAFGSGLCVLAVRDRPLLPQATGPVVWPDRDQRIAVANVDVGSPG